MRSARGWVLLLCAGRCGGRQQRAVAHPSPAAAPCCHRPLTIAAADDDDEGGGADAGVVGRRYHAVQPGLTVDALTAMPCGACPVTAQCEPGGVISPETCVYFTKWLEF